MASVGFRRSLGKEFSTLLGSNVSIVGKVVSSTGSTCVVESSDKTTIHVSDANWGGPSPPQSAVIELFGKVTGKERLEFNDYALLSAGFDMDCHNELVAFASGPYARLFGSR